MSKFDLGNPVWLDMVGDWMLRRVECQVHGSVRNRMERKVRPRVRVRVLIRVMSAVSNRVGGWINYGGLSW